MLYFIKNSTLLVVFILLITSVDAQIVPSRHISIADGLPNNQVESILKDSRGILWVGTNNGLSKIEGGKISNFYVADGLAHNSIWDIIEDENKHIWIGTYGGGVTKFDGKTFSKFNKEKGLVNNYVRKLFAYKNHVFVGTKNGLSFINTENDSISTIDTSTIIDLKSGKPDFQVMDFFIYKDELYCGTFRVGIFKINIKNKTVKRVFRYQNNWDYLFSIYVKDSLLYYSVDGANNPNNKATLKKFSIDKLIADQKEDLLFGESIVWDYASDHKNNLYSAAWAVYTNDGGVYQIKDNKFINRSLDFGVESENIRCLYFDKEFNTLYVGSTDKGLYEVNLNENITYYKNNKLDVVDIEYSKPNIAFLNKKSLTIINNNTIIKHITNSEFLNFSIKTFSNNLPTSRELYNSLLRVNTDKDIVFYKIVYKDASYWISSYIGLFQLDLEGNFLRFLPIRTNEFEFDFSNRLINPIPYTSLDIISDFENFFGTENGYKTTRFPGDNPNTPVNVTSFIKSNDKIYIATLYKGLFLYENDTFTSLNEKNLFNELEINHLALINKSNTLVISTTSGEIYYADITTEFTIIKRIKRELIEGHTVLFLETYKGYVIIGTNEGLTICKKGVNQFFDEEQGLMNYEFTSSKVIDDELVLGTEGGYYIVNLAKITNQVFNNLDLKIADLSINHKEMSDTVFKWFNYEKKTLNLKYYQNTLELDFKSTNHPYPNKLRYSFKVEGLDIVWSKYSKKRNIFLFHMPHGTFDIIVKVKDLNSGQITTSNLISIIIAPPFWKTWWFITSALLVITLINFILYRIRVNTIKKREIQKAKIRRRLVETKLEALQSHMNPHFTFNAMNSIQNYIIDNDIDNALMYLSEFAKLIRQTLDNSSQHLITLAREIKYLKSYIAIENMRFNNKVRVKLDYKNLEIDEIMIFPMLFQPFVENVFMHAFDKDHKNPSLHITFSMDKDILHCEISDNGKGMTKTTSSQLHQSKGLKLVTERLELLKKTSFTSLKISSNKHKGTTVLIDLQT